MKTCLRIFLLGLIFSTTSYRSNAQCGGPVVDEDFSSDPACWTYANGAYVSGGELRMWNSGGFDQFAVLPPVNNSQGVLTLDARRYNSNFGAGTLDIGVMPCSTCWPSFDKITHFTPTTTSHTSFTFDLSEYAGSGLYIAIKSPYYNTGGRANLDNIYYRSYCTGSTGAIALTQDVTVFLDATGSVIVDAAVVNNGSSDTCGDPVTVSLDIDTFDCTDLGENTVTLTAEDGDGNSAQATATVTVVPTFDIQDVQLYLDAAGQATLSAFDLDLGQSSTCELSLTFDQTSFDCSHLGLNEIGFYYDLAGQPISAGSINVHVNDDHAPDILTNDLNVTLDENGIAMIDTQMVDNGTTDNCGGGVLLTLSQTTFTCSDIGDNLVTITATDAHGNSATESFTVTVDVSIIEYSVSASQENICTDGSTGTTISLSGSDEGVNYYLRNSANDAIIDGPISGTGSSIDFNTGNLSETTTFNVLAEMSTAVEGAGLDFNGNSSYISAGTNGRGISTKVTIAAWVKTGHAGSTNNFIVAKYNGVTGFVLFIDTDGHLRLDGRDGTGVYKRSGPSTTQVNDDQWHYLAGTANLVTGEWKVYVDGALESSLSNGAGSTLQNTFNFTIAEYNGNYFNGEINQVALWKEALTENQVATNASECLLGFEDNLVLLYDLDEGESTAIDDKSTFEGDALLYGSYSWIALEAACQATCDFQMGNEVTIGDQGAPTVSSQSVTLSLDASGAAILNASDLDNGSADACSSVSFSVDQNQFTCEDLGQASVEFTVTDASGNSTTETVTIQIVDQMAPTAIGRDATIGLDESGNATLAAWQVNNFSEDNCDQDLTFSLSQVDFDCSHLGANTVTMTVSDDSGNSSSTDVTVTVIDQTAPATMPLNIELELDHVGQASLAGATLNGGTTDNCSTFGQFTFDVNKDSFTCADLGENTVTLTTTDAAGNSSATTSVVTIVDNLAPSVQAQDISVRLNENNLATIEPSDVDNGSTDNCSLTLSLDRSSFDLDDLGDQTVQLTATDQSGNTSSANATVTIEPYKQNQTISLGILDDVSYGHAPIMLSPSASSGLPVELSILSGNAVTLDGNTLTIVGTGLVTILAIQAGNDDFFEEQTQQSFEVVRTNLTVTVQDQSMTFGDPIPTLTFEYSGFVYDEGSSSLTTEPAITISGQFEGSIPAGAYDLVASGGDSENYTFTYVDGTLTVDKAAQTITIQSIPDKRPDDASFEVVASVDSNLDLAYLVTGPATISGTTISLTGDEGTVEVTVSQAGTNNFQEASATESFEVAIPLSVNHEVVKIFPNPVSDELNIEMNGAFTVRIFGMDGQLIRSVVNQNRIDLSDLESGLYLLDITNERGTTVKKIKKN